MPHRHRHLPSIMLHHHRHLMVFIMPLLEVGILKVTSDLSNNTKYRTTRQSLSRPQHFTNPPPSDSPPDLPLELYNAPPPPPPNGPQLEVWILKVISDLSDTKYRTTDRAFKDHNTLPTPYIYSIFFEHK